MSVVQQLEGTSTSFWGFVSRKASRDLPIERHGGRYEYTALEGEGAGTERLELERKAKEEASSACSHYLKGSTRYTLIHHLKDVGSRVDKHWFVVRDTSVKTERLLTLTPRSPACPIRTDGPTRGIVLDLLTNLQHPYIYPVLDLEFRESAGEVYILLVIPYNAKGSLKDLIYKSMWSEDWGEKYGQRSEGLPGTQVQRLGRQILEALFFLKERGFPSSSQLHSGNIIIQNGVARLSGLENVLFGYTSRIYPIISKAFRSEPSVVDVILFGHVLFEMCAGYELTVAVPTPANLLDIVNYPQVVEVLEFIFNNPKQRVPSIEELLLCEFFRNIDLREMRATSLPFTGYSCAFGSQASHIRDFAVMPETAALMVEARLPKAAKLNKRCKGRILISPDITYLHSQQLIMNKVYHAHLTASTLALLNEVKRQQKSRRGRRSHSTSTDNTSPAGSHREHSDSEEVKESGEESEEEITGGSHEDSDTDTAQEFVEHRHLSLHLYQNLSPVKLEEDDLLR